MRLLSVKNFCRGKIERGQLHQDALWRQESNLLLRLRGALPDEPVPCATGRMFCW